MSDAAHPLRALHGAALDAAFTQKWTTDFETVPVGSGAQARTFTLFKPANADHLISEADYVMDERLPYWADLWPSAHVLAGALLSMRGEGRTLLELGCGLGLDTTAAMAAGFSVTATDYYEDAIHMARGNAARNLGREPQARLVNWRAWPDDLGTFDVVIAADVLYEKEYASLVGACVARALAPQGEAIIADPGRLALPAFLEHLPTVGLELVHRSHTPYE
ncbi:class I SAM-dependent methyltransferase, partial [Gemmatimonas sp.]